MAIFQLSNGMPVKFFIQRGLSEELEAELIDKIEKHGGRVEPKVPRAGFVLVHPGTPEANRLRECWQSVDRPGRSFTPYTFIDTCISMGRILKQVFTNSTDGNSPVLFHMHASIANPAARSSLASLIVHCGGEPYATQQEASVIIADPSNEAFRQLVSMYEESEKFVESQHWVRKCVDTGQMIFTPVVYKNPGGRRPGEERTQFSDQDEQHLCGWIAAKIPYKETGGRTGNRLYQQLCDQEGAEFEWVKRHTWQSWRERYKKNAERLDKIIERMVAENNTPHGSKGQYGYVRQSEEKPRRSRKKKAGASGTQDLLADDNAPFPLPAAPTSNAAAQPSTSKAPAEEEMGTDDEDSPEWAVRIGNAPPPAWASSSKRKASLDGSVDTDKRPRTERNSPAVKIDILSPAPIPPTPTPAPLTPAQEPAPTPTQLPAPLPPATLMEVGLHVIDQSIRDIAKEYRFTVEEVQEFYDKCGEMGETRSRFERMRKLLAEEFKD